ncbi:MAG TPA: type 1 glutamine amidotransferase [Enhygromyxa sp.]|nr:type 1 glutamine amidotransferase [Enhygromyxa sp.]
MSRRLLILDAYDEAGRATLRRVGAVLAGELYRRMTADLAADARLDVVEFSSAAGFVLPEGVALGDYDGVLWTGSSMTVHHDTPAVRLQLELARAAYASGVPSFGSCWAAQIAVTAAGGRCQPNPKGREFGVARKITLTEAGRAHAMYRGKPIVFDGLTSHEDHIVELPPGATLLAGNRVSPVQAVVVAHERGSFWAVQYHPEYQLADVAALSIARQAQLIAQGSLRDQADADAWRAELLALHADPSRGDLRFRLGIDDDVLDPTIRTRELDNWLAAHPPRR